MTDKVINIGVSDSMTTRQALEHALNDADDLEHALVIGVVRDTGADYMVGSKMSRGFANWLLDVAKIAMIRGVILAELGIGDDDD